MDDRDLAEPVALARDPSSHDGANNDDDASDRVTLRANDSTVHYVSRRAASLSTVMADACTEAGSGSLQLVLQSVDGPTLALVLKWMEHHSVHPMEPLEKPLPGKIEDLISEWDKAFLFTDLVKDHDERQHETLMDVCNGANALQVQGLVEFTCACVASMIKGKTPEQIRALFNIENDFTPEEEEKIREENRWCVES